jgi:hypothetical protein
MFNGVFAYMYGKKPAPEQPEMLLSLGIDLGDGTWQDIWRNCLVGETQKRKAAEREAQQARDEAAEVSTRLTKVAKRLAEKARMENYWLGKKNQKLEEKNEEFFSKSWRR